MAAMPTPFMPRGPAGAGAAGAGPAMLPKSPIGAPAGPGASPMVSPGNNAGGKAKATAKIKACMQTMLAEAMNFEPGTKEFNGIMGAIKNLNALFGKPSDADLVPAARRQIAQAPKPPLAGSPPPGLGGGAPPSMPPGGVPGGEAPAEY